MRLQTGLQTHLVLGSVDQESVGQVDVSAAGALCMQSGPCRQLGLPLRLSNRACPIVFVE